MKVGDLVQWYTEYADDVTIDYGLVVELDETLQQPGDAKGAYIHWFSNDGSGWFDICHPAIGVISESR
tara:strand:- start:2841 stop:3044 length:204 start_codon:yes stop_codon:yes gene_type:complete